MITKTDFDTKQTKHLLVESELNKLKTFDSGYFIRKSHFEEDGTQNYLVFQPIYRYFKVFSITKYLELSQNGNLKDYLVNVLRRFLPQIIVLIQH